MSHPSKSSGPLGKLAASFRSLRARHKQRAQPSGYGFAFADRVDFLDPARWDSVTAGSTVFLTRELLRTVEQHGPENIIPRYAMIFRGDQAVAAVAAQIVAISAEQLRRAPGTPGKKRSLLRQALKPAAVAASGKFRERVLVAGNLLSWGFHGIAFAGGENAAMLWPAVAEALYRIRRAEKLTGQTDFVMVKDVTDAQGGLEALHQYSYRPLETEPNMVLAIDASWRCYDDYLAALDSKYRRNAKEQLKKLAGAECVIEVLPELEPHSKCLHALYKAVQGNASVRLVTLGESYLPALSRVLGDRFRCTVIRRGGQLLGFVTTIRDGDTAIGYYIGFDRSAAAQGLPVYLRLLHATISDAIGWGCRRLSLGRTALEPKAALGGKPEPMAVWLRHRVPAMNWLLRGLMGAIPHEEAPDRNPFKSG